MKNTLISLIAIFCVTVCAFSLKIQNAPNAAGLRNHFGAPSVENIYGPKTDNIAEYVAANPETFTPMKYAAGNKQIDDAMKFRKDGLPGYEHMLVPHVVKAGEFTNMAPSASTIINPEIAGKLFNTYKLTKINL